MARKDLRKLALERKFLMRQIDAWKAQHTATVTFQSEFEQGEVTFTNPAEAQCHLDKLEGALAKKAAPRPKPWQRRAIA